MCFGGGGGDGGSNAAADQAAAQEALRQQRIAESNAAIEQEFSGFGDPFYSGVANQYNEYYLPQVDEQFAGARRNLKASAPTTRSSDYQSQLADLIRDYGRQRASIASQAEDRAGAMRSDIAKQKTNLLSLAMTGADPLAMSQQAAQTAQSIQAPQSFSPLGDLFARYTGQVYRNASLQLPEQGGRGPAPLLFGAGSNVRSVS